MIVLAFRLARRAAIIAGAIWLVGPVWITDGEQCDCVPAAIAAESPASLEQMPGVCAPPDDPYVVALKRKIAARNDHITYGNPSEPKRQELVAELILLRAERDILTCAPEIVFRSPYRDAPSFP